MRTTLLSLAVPLMLTAPAIVAADLPHAEHPRPDFRREPWVNLNGVWSFDFDPKDEGEAERWFEPAKHQFGRQITVPFPWESKLSGIDDTKYQGVAWYAREVTLPAGEGWNGKNAWLIVGACDFEAKVWVNGKPAGEHVGGYMPFDVDLSRFAKPGEKVLVVIRAKDTTGPDQPTGKQTGWYTRTSGIWQTVYVEPRPESFIRSLQYTTDMTTGEVHYTVRLTGKGDGLGIHIARADLPTDDGPVLAVSSGDEPVGQFGFQVGQPKPWSPDSPTLYPTRITLFKGLQIVDQVESYFGFREITVAKAPGRDYNYNYIYLNGKPIYLCGALHQSFHPDGIYQYPDDAAIRSDYEFCKKIGLNFLRIHIKNAIPRELYWADKLGVLIMQDMPNYTHNNENSHKLWEENLRAAVARDFNHPAIFAWCDFNETWGIGHGGYKPETQQWVADMYRLTRQLDPTRLVEDNSPCTYDHVITDINSWHFYINDYAAAKKHIQEVVAKTFPGSEFNYAKSCKQADAPLINSEYGGIGAGSGDQDVSWCFKFLTNELRKHDKICGYVYTELSDIEWEHNGFLNYDRTPKEFGYDFWFPGMSLKDLNNPDFIVLDAEPCIVLKPGEKRDVPVLISHWSDREAKDLKLRWRIDWIDRFASRHKGEWQTRPAAWKPYAVTSQEAIGIAAPEDPKAPDAGRLGALLVELADAQGGIARNYLNIFVDVPSPRLEAPDERRLFVRFKPGDFAAWDWPGQPMPVVSGVAADEVCATGAGAVEYELQLPEAVPATELSMIRFTAELSARAKDERLDWPARKTPMDCPQTDGRKWPTQVRVTINGVEIVRQELPDDPADARGVLSHRRGHHPGSYGYTVRGDLVAEDLKRVAAAMKGGAPMRIRFEVPADATRRGGLAIFGEGLGGWSMDPTLMLILRRPHRLGAGFESDVPVAVNRAVSREQVLIPTAEQGGHEWRYTIDRPADDWAAPEFSDKKWKTGKGGFGTRETPNAIIGKKWTTPDIWLRTEVDVKDIGGIVSGRWRLYHDEDCEVYVNGTKVLERPGFVTDYFDVPLDASALRLLHDGRNVVAVHCRQTGGGQNIDVGLTLVRKPGGK
jgi:hypothetical protein